MKKTLIALSLAAFAMGAAAPSFAADAKSAACKPAKKGYEMKDGKCVKMKAAEKKK